LLATTGVALTTIVGALLRWLSTNLSIPPAQEQDLPSSLWHGRDRTDIEVALRDIEAATSCLADFVREGCTPWRGSNGRRAIPKYRSRRGRQHQFRVWPDPSNKPPEEFVEGEGENIAPCLAKSAI
jgi:hypothetical protein